jgi:hypothetical protein
MKSSFEAAFPNITRLVKGFGTVEIGYDPGTASFIRAIDKGGMAWSGESHYKSLDNAFEHLENGIKAITGTRMRSAKRKVISKPSKTTKPPDRRKNLLPKDPLARQIQKLDKIIEAIRRNENVWKTRLTVIKKLCEDRLGAGAFALFLARKSQERLRKKQGKKRYRALVNQAIREMKPYLDDPSEDRTLRLLALLREIEGEQNEYESIGWSIVRNIKSWDLLIVENTLRSILRPHEAPYWLYQAVRDHMGSSEFLTAESIPKIEEIARFWRRYFKIKA